MTLRGTQTLIAKSVLEFDQLMREIGNLHKKFITFDLNAVAEWQTMATGLNVDSIDSRKLVAKNIGEWGKFVSKVRQVENQVITDINEGRSAEQEKIKPVFSCTITMKYEKKDKEAQKVLEDPKQLKLFGPFLSDKEILDLKTQNLIQDMKPDGKNIDSIKFQKMKDGVAVGKPVELRAK